MKLSCTHFHHTPLCISFVWLALASLLFWLWLCGTLELMLRYVLTSGVLNAHSHKTALACVRLEEDVQIETNGFVEGAHDYHG